MLEQTVGESATERACIETTLHNEESATEKITNFKLRVKKNELILHLLL